MSAVTDNQDWLVERGHSLIEKRSHSGKDSLHSWEILIYCLWTAEIMLRNSGDLANAVAMYPEFQADAKSLAEELALPKTLDTFSLATKALEAEYFDRFEEVCDELRAAEPEL